MTDAPILELRAVTRTFGAGDTEVHALADVDLARGARRDGRRHGAVAAPASRPCSPWPARSSTPAAGEVLIDGQDVATLSRAEVARLRRRTIGFVFQDLNLLPGLSAIENVSLPLELDGQRTGARARTRRRRRSPRSGSAERAGHFPDQLSGGERQRVAIARAVTGGRHLLLADEPSGSLDLANAEAVMGQIRAACHAGVAAVVVTHDAHLAAMADRVVHLLDGRLVDADPAIMSGPARRAVRRWTWRLFAREWRQQTLIVGAHRRRAGRDHRRRRGRDQRPGARQRPAGHRPGRSELHPDRVGRRPGRGAATLA